MSIDQADVYVSDCHNSHDNKIGIKYDVYPHKFASVRDITGKQNIRNNNETLKTCIAIRRYFRDGIFLIKENMFWINNTTEKNYL
jgi:hypothetical protein